MTHENILISGWPGSGSTALSLLLAKTFNMTLLRGTETFRYLGGLLEKSNTGKDRIESDNYLEPYFGPIYDKYIDYKLMNGQGLVIESDIGAFRLGKQPEFFSIFLIANYNTRLNRLGNDGRKKDINVLKEREESLTKIYHDLHGINWTNMNQIQSKYNLVLDNTNLSLADEIEIIANELLRKEIISKDRHELIISGTEKLEREYWKEGKDFYIDYLTKNKKIMQAEDVLKEINSVFYTDVQNLPVRIRSIVSINSK